MLVTQAFLCAGGVSVPRWQSLSSSKKPRAAMQPWLPQPLPALPPCKVRWGCGVGTWKTGAGAPQARAAGTKNWGFANLGKNVLPQSLMILPNSSYSQARFSAEINNNGHFLPRSGFFVRQKALPQAPSPLAAGVSGAFLKLLGSLLGW